VIARLKETYRGMRLGTRLALGLGALALVVFAVVGSALTMYMRDYLSRQLDEQLHVAQVAQSKSIAADGTLEGKKYWGWYYAVYDIKDGTPELRTPEDSVDLPQDIDDFTRLAADQVDSDTEITRTEQLGDAGLYRLRACEAEPGVILVGAAPLEEVEDTVEQLVTIQVIAFALALAALVVFGRAMLRRGLKPLSDMAHTARGITSHDLTDSARLPVRHDRRDGGPEVEELRTAFNRMLEHIDDAFAVRTAAEQRLRQFVADASHELRTPLMSVRGYADLFQYAAAHSPEERDKHLARLKRRCLHLFLDYPDAERELEIVRAKDTGLAEATARHLVDVVRGLRELPLRKSPSISETVDWARTLAVLGVDELGPEVLADTANVVLKYERDLHRALEVLPRLVDPNRTLPEPGHPHHDGHHHDGHHHPGGHHHGPAHGEPEEADGHAVRAATDRQGRHDEGSYGAPGAGPAHRTTSGAGQGARAFAAVTRRRTN
jgi:signal transduction histidine kinase